MCTRFISYRFGTLVIVLLLPIFLFSQPTYMRYKKEMLYLFFQDESQKQLVQVHADSTKIFAQIISNKKLVVTKTKNENILWKRKLFIEQVAVNDTLQYISLAPFNKQFINNASKTIYYDVIKELTLKK